MGIFGSLCHLKSLSFYENSYVGQKMSCPSKSFPLLRTFQIKNLENLEALVLENGSMPNLKRLDILFCNKLNRFPDVLPLSVNKFKVVGNGGYQRHAHLDNGVQIVDPYGFGKWLKDVEDAVLNREYDKVVLSGKAGVGKATNAMNLLSDIQRHFDAVAWTCVPKATNAGSGLPRRILQKLLRGLNPRLSRESMSQLSCGNLKGEIQQVMQANKCLVVLLNLEDVHHLDTTLFGRQGFHRGTKLFITSCREPVVGAAEYPGKLLVFRLRPPTNSETWEMLERKDYTLSWTNAGIKWNMLRRCSGHPLSAKILAGLLKLKENITEWATKHEELTDSSPLHFSQIFAICYDDLPLHLRPCLIYLANFPEDVEISTKKLYQMWIAAGFVRSKHDDHDVQTEEYLENLASSYLTELEQRGMVTILKRGAAERAKTCQLKFALRDLCLEKAKEEHLLMIVDQVEHTTSASQAKLKTQQLALHLDQISPASLDEQLSSLNLITSPISLVIFPNISDPVYNEENWEWLLYICKHFQLLRVLDVEGMWMTKGRLPKEVGNLRQLRYLSLRGTWVSELPPSIENLMYLQTLDLRVLEPIIIPDVLCKLNCLMHLYLPDKIAQETQKLRLLGLNCLQTLVNLHTDKVHLEHLCELKLLRKMSIKKIHKVDDELRDILEPLCTSSDLDLIINSEVITANSTILSSFQHLRKLKIKGRLLVELHLEMFPAQLEELTLKHTKLEQDPLPVLEKLLQLRSLFFDHESFLGKTITISEEFNERVILTLRSLSNLQLCVPKYDIFMSTVRIDCWPGMQIISSSSIRDEEEHVLVNPGCFDLSYLKKRIQSFTCR